jgi:hypothetical protein
VPTVAALPAAAGKVGAVLTDNGFYSEQAVQQIEQTMPIRLRANRDLGHNPRCT